MQEQTKKIEQIKTQVIKDIENIQTLNDCNDLRVKYLSKKGEISSLTSIMSSLDIEEKKVFGKLLNDLKDMVSKLLDEKKTVLEEVELNKKLQNEKIDISLPATKINTGAPNILEKIIEEVEEVFMSMGYDVVDGPEIEQDKYNFELLNIPKGHPARDAQDTF